ncbi:hypothetical protein MKX03_018714 [Papaver bracteatum]|nr:hypothetical protein MKX03_018714 [Papaver bracteatum]
MEKNTSVSYLDLKLLIFNNLTDAKELLKQLEFEDTSSTTGNLLIPIILSSFEKSLSLLSGINPEAGGSRSEIKSDHMGNSPSRKRKAESRWTEQVRVCERTGLEAPIDDDGYSWRKYGEKSILETKYPRSYYKCALQKAQDCSAMKQVQRNDDDPLMFSVTYRRKHTCNQVSYVSSPVKSGNITDEKHKEKRRQEKTQETIISFQIGPRVQRENSDGTTQTVLISPSFTFPSVEPLIPVPWVGKESNNNNNNMSSSFTPGNHRFMISSPSSSSPYMSLLTSEPNSFSPYAVNGFEGGLTLQTSDYDLCDFTFI